MGLSPKDIVWCEYDGYIVAESERGIGLGKTVVSAPELWLPKSQVSEIAYASGDSKAIVRAEHLTAIKLPRWLGREKQLLGPDD